MRTRLWGLAGAFCNWRRRRCYQAVLRWSGWQGDVNAREDIADMATR